MFAKTAPTVTLRAIDGLGIVVHGQVVRPIN